MPLPLALAGGSFIVVAVCALVVLGVAIGWYTRRGSEISAHPSDGRGAAPGGAQPSRVSGPASDDVDTRFTAPGTR